MCQNEIGAKKLQNNWKFRVYLVTDGPRGGLLVGRQRPASTASEYAYFWDDGPPQDGRLSGLSPSQAGQDVLNLCRDRLHRLTTRDERRFLDAMCTCASLLDGGTVPKDRIPVEEVASDYWAVLRLFSQSDLGLRRNKRSFLRECFISKEVFLTSVLSGNRKRGYLALRAGDFGVLRTQEVIALGDIHPLQHVRDVLRLTHTFPPQGTGSAELFRHVGPLGIDFDRGYLYERKALLAKATALLLENDFSVLEGPPASGKTVLVRHLAYSLYKQEYTRVYLFDDNAFDVDRLACMITAVRGIVIVENVHRNIAACQRLLGRLAPSSHRHVLFTTRVPLGTIEQSWDARFSDLPTLTIAPQDDADAIVAFFAECFPSIQWTTELRERLTRQSEAGYWWLSYAVRGRIKAGDTGTLDDWVHAGVRADLRDLERCGDPLAEQYPEILVALSPLYMNETATSQDYLLGPLGFAKPALDRLLEKGRIIRYDSHGADVMYGLPHSSLASLYWSCGLEYRQKCRLKECDEFILDYAMSGQANGLEACSWERSSLWDLADQLRERLQADSVLRLKVLEREQSLENIADFIDPGNYPFIPDDALVAMLSRKIAETDDLSGIAEILSVFARQPLSIGSCDSTEHSGAAEAVPWCDIDVPLLAEKIMAPRSEEGLRSLLSVLHCGLPTFATDVFARLDERQLLRTCSQQAWPVAWLVLLRVIKSRMPGRLRADIEATDWAALSEAFVAGELWPLCSVIGLLAEEVGEGALERLAAVIPVSRLAQRISGLDDKSTGLFIKTLRQFCPEVAWKVCQEIDRDQLASYINKRLKQWGADHVYDCLEAIVGVSPECAIAVIRQVDKTLVSAVIAKGLQSWEPWRFLLLMNVLAHEWCSEVCGLMDPGQTAQAVNAMECSKRCTSIRKRSGAANRLCVEGHMAILRWINAGWALRVQSALSKCEPRTAESTPFSLAGCVNLLEEFLGRPGPSHASMVIAYEEPCVRGKKGTRVLSMVGCLESVNMGTFRREVKWTTEHLATFPRCSEG